MKKTVTILNIYVTFIIFVFLNSCQESEQEKIDRIHKEFIYASDTLYETAKTTHQLAAMDTNINQLKSIGLINSESVILDIQKDLDARDYENALYYKKYYPNNPFITSELMVKIAWKYDLEIGGLEKYTGFVPEKNINDISSFNLKKLDYNILRETYCNSVKLTNDTSTPYRELDYSSIDGIHIYGDMAYVEEPLQRFSLDGNSSIYSLLSFNIKEYYDSIYDFNNNLSIDLWRKRFHKRNDAVDSIMDIITKKGYLTLSKKKYEFELEKIIIAPSKDMGGTTTVVPDPIVLQPVKGGYLVVTMLGLEKRTDKKSN